MTIICFIFLFASPVLSGFKKFASPYFVLQRGKNYTILKIRIFKFLSLELISLQNGILCSVNLSQIFVQNVV